ncbi:MAG: hypothetical protein Q4B22_11240 [Eubacteriales bacterium]|nr:hypothetical protein [Eubacteriales bacterium]
MKKKIVVMSLICSLAAGSMSVYAEEWKNADQAATKESAELLLAEEPAEGSDEEVLLGRSASFMYRLYNPNSGEHFYTDDEEEKTHLEVVGWNYEGGGWAAPSHSDTPVYRLYNPNAGDHHYTMDAGEREYLVQAGWSYEGIGWYSTSKEGVPVYRAYNPNAKAGAHNYTTEKGEQEALIKAGWRDEGIGWYAIMGASALVVPVMNRTPEKEIPLRSQNRSEAFGEKMERGY